MAKGFLKRRKEDISMGELIAYQGAVEKINDCLDIMKMDTEEYITENCMNVPDYDIYSDRIKAQLKTIKDNLEVIEYFGKKYGGDW